MTTNTLNLADSETALPRDLRLRFGERGLLELALEAVLNVALQGATFHAERSSELSPRMMLTLLTYCYAAGIYGSEDIEWAVGSDATVRYICAHAEPGWPAIRMFRRSNRQWLEQCLVHLLGQAAARWRAGADGQDASAAALPMESYADALAWARRKLELAIMIDTAASD
jgi:hypothetical protein